MNKKNEISQRGYEFLLYDFLLEILLKKIHAHNNCLGSKDCLESKKLELEESITDKIERYLRLDCLSESKLIPTSDKTNSDETKIAQIKDELKGVDQCYKEGLEQLTTSLQGTGFKIHEKNDSWIYFLDKKFNKENYYSFDSKEDIGFGTKIYLKIDPKRFLTDEDFKNKYFSFVEKIANEFSKQEISHTFKLLKEFFEDKRITGDYDSARSYISGNECLIFYLNNTKDNLSKAKGIIKELLRDYNITDEEIRVFRVGFDSWDKNANARSTYTQMITQNLSRRILKNPKEYCINITPKQLEEKLNHDLQEIREDIFNKASKYVTN